ncbi:vacuolar import and degradation protein-domain-containing protein [Achaetomium macrosporum]|uniref:Vacuolar import and degradation protein-domain-containing protein n=1 Tax=Achaetomium macrosporum TaxID=79813 RepID=A0AAN7C287_9PEZI|nr:vacuolar import and degradation protein-domain-containing protein [Achaetomium macrosporum]
MPTPSSDESNQHSQRFYPFISSCPDLEEQPQQVTSQTASETAISPESPSQAGWRSLVQPPDSAEPRAWPSRQSTNADLGSAAMSPGPQPEGDGIRDVDMDLEQQSQQIQISRSGAQEGQKSADVDEDMSSSVDDSSGHGIPGRGKREVAKRTVGETPGRRKTTTEALSPVAGDIHEADAWSPIVGKGPRWVEDSGLVGLGLEYSHMRVIPPPTSLYLQPGSRFVGTQQSERQRYDVEVQIKHVDMRESFLCGYLRIQGLTNDHPTLTTYFEGEIIGTKYGFITQHQGWGATEKIDFSHWNKFTAFRPYHKQARKGGQIVIKDVDQRENIFMRWKEHFLVPDHRVRTINGASFEGFYYICFNQVRGEVSGIYFHSKSEKFQQLELTHVENRGCFGALEFR